jgi:hypothetical protein
MVMGEKHDDDRGAAWPPDRRVQPGEVRIGSTVLSPQKAPARGDRG